MKDDLLKPFLAINFPEIDEVLLFGSYKKIYEPIFFLKLQIHFFRNIKFCN